MTTSIADLVSDLPARILRERGVDEQHVDYAELLVDAEQLVVQRVYITLLQAVPVATRAQYLHTNDPVAMLPSLIAAVPSAESLIRAAVDDLTYTLIH